MLTSGIKLISYKYIKIIIRRQVLRIRMEKTYKVNSIHCEHCIHTIEMELGEIEGVVSVKANLKEKTVNVVFGPPATEELILGTLKEINYPAEI
jgi:copper chaperone CopZ